MKCLTQKVLYDKDQGQNWAFKGIPFLWLLLNCLQNTVCEHFANNGAVASGAAGWEAFLKKYFYGINTGSRSNLYWLIMAQWGDG